MNDFNSVTITGRLGQDPKIGTAQTGSEYGFMSLAISESWKDRGGEWKERTHWVSVSVSGFSVKAMNNLAKGDYVIVNGSLESWKDKENKTQVRIKGQKIQKIKCIFKEDDAPVGEGKHSPPSNSQENPPYQQYTMDDVPF